MDMSEWMQHAFAVTILTVGMIVVAIPSHLYILLHDDPDKLARYAADHKERERFFHKVAFIDLNIIGWVEMTLALLDEQRAIFWLISSGVLLVMTIRSYFLSKDSQREEKTS